MTYESHTVLQNVAKLPINDFYLYRYMYLYKRGKKKGFSLSQSQNYFKSGSLTYITLAMNSYLPTTYLNVAQYCLFVGF